MSNKKQKKAIQLKRLRVIYCLKEDDEEQLNRKLLVLANYIGFPYSRNLDYVNVFVETRHVDFHFCRLNNPRGPSSTSWFSFFAKKEAIEAHCVTLLILRISKGLPYYIIRRIMPLCDRDLVNEYLGINKIKTI